MTAKDYQIRGPIRIFLSYFTAHRGLFALDMLCALLIALVDLAFPLISRTAMYQWLPEKRFAVFFVVMAIVVAAFALRSVLYFVVCYWGHTFGIRVEADIRRDLFYHMQELGFDYYDRNRTGVLMSRLTTDLFEVTELAHHGPEDLLISAVTIIGALIVMFTVEWRLALVVCLIIPVFLLVLVRCRREMGEASKRAKQKTGTINAEIESALSGFRTTRAFANEGEQRRRFDGANEVFKTAKREFHKAMGRFLSTMEFFISILSVTVIAVGGWLIMDGRMNYIDLITFSLYITAFVNPIRKLANFAELFSNGFAGLHRFIELMATEPSIQDASDAVELCHVAGQVEVDHVSFTYDGDAEVLRDVSLSVAAGETVAIVGPSGGGKSTLCQLVPRFYEVTQGRITIDGTDIRHVTQRSLHRAIGIVQQDVFLFADTVRENIRYGRPDATDEEVADAARRAEIYDDIMAMPGGFDTYVGERGMLLSGGQKQRVAIARIFLKNPPILILDEATSALDSVTEAKIQHAFDELAVGRTTLIIAHRLSTIRSANRILVVQDGEIVEQGRHRELLEKDGAYARLYNTQNLGGAVMDKRALLDTVAENSDERVLLGHVWDKVEQARRRNIPAVTGFLSPAEQAAAERLLRSMKAEGYAFFGGYDTAQRRQLHVLPDWQEEPDEEAVCALRCRFYHADKAPTHRDFLGSLMGMGITRSSVGDILVSSESADVLVSTGVADFLLQQWNAAGRVPLRIERIALSELLVPPEQIRELRDTVASLRLDSVAAAAFSISRGKAAEAIAAGRVEVNWTECRKADRAVEMGDVITLRGAGKCRLDSVGNPTRKGRFPICIWRYV